ncbi:MAG: ferritin family protein [Candidatus Woesearchaeota archaeon]
MERTIKAVVNLAIKSEEQAYTFYNSAYKETKIKSAKILFKKLFEEEKKHKQRLLKIKKDPKNIVFKKTRLNHIRIAKSLIMTPLNEIYELRKIFMIAIKKEEQAFKMYKKMANNIKTKTIKNILVELAKQEAKHKALLVKTEKKCF